MPDIETGSIRKETQKRTCVKAIGWRFIATIITIIISLIYIGDLSLALKIGAVDTIIKFTLYYVYERMFAKIKWGIEENDDRS
jgi:uncharacterized membrane protein